MHTYILRDFMDRANTKPFDDLTLAKVLLHLPPIAQYGAWLAGGALRRTALGEEPTSDFDLFFRNEEDKISYGVRLEQNGLKRISATEHQTLYRGKLVDQERDVQLIHFRYYGSVQEVIDSFDYTICQLATDGTMMFVGDYTLWDLGRKRLAVNKINFPVSSLRRLIKYTKQGFYACDGTLRDLLMSGRDETLPLNINYVD